MGTILIVEDEQIIAKDIEASLGQMGHDVLGIAASGEEAIAMTAARKPDLVLMDIRIRGPMDGVESASALRIRFGVPIVFLTAHGDAKTVSRARAVAPAGYLLKPFSDRQLETTIASALESECEGR
jgi:DNA-binding NarL/FixJ family response regulator